jgi:hypothetical protein
MIGRGRCDLRLLIGRLRLRIAGLRLGFAGRAEGIEPGAALRATLGCATGAWPAGAAARIAAERPQPLLELAVAVLQFLVLAGQLPQLVSSRWIRISRSASSDAPGLREPAAKRSTGT